MKEQSLNAMWISWLPHPIRRWITGRPELQRLIGNTGWLLVDRIFGMGLGVVVGIAVARYLGPQQYGLYSYAMAFIALFAILATLGIDGILTREIVRDPASVGEVLGTVFGMKLVATLITIAIIVGAICWLRPHDSLSHWMVAITAVSLIFRPLDVIDVWFQSQIRARATVIARNSALLVTVAARFYLILTGAPLIAFVWAGFAEVGLTATGLMISYLVQRQHISSWRVSPVRAWQLLKECWPLILAGLSVTIYMKIDQVMLGELLGDAAVGIYSVATRISEMSYFIPIVLMSSLAPSTIAAKGVSEEIYYQQIQRIFNLMALLAFSLAVALTVLAQPLVTLLFGPMYRDASTALTIHVWAMLFVFLGTAQSTWDIVEGLTIYGLLRTASGAMINIALNLWLIPLYAGAGAAAATLISYACSAWILNAVSSKTRKIFWRQLRALLFVDIVAQVRLLTRRKVMSKGESPEEDCALP